MCILSFNFWTKKTLCVMTIVKPYYKHKEVRESREGLRKSSHLPHNELLFSIHLLGHQPQIFSTSLYHLPYPQRPPPLLHPNRDKKCNPNANLYRFNRHFIKNSNEKENFPSLTFLFFHSLLFWYRFCEMSHDKTYAWRSIGVFKLRKKFRLNFLNKLDRYRLINLTHRCCEYKYTIQRNARIA